MATLKQLVDEITNIKNELITCHTDLKNNLIDKGVEVLETDKICDLVNSIKDLKNYNFPVEGLTVTTTEAFVSGGANLDTVTPDFLTGFYRIPANTLYRLVKVNIIDNSYVKSPDTIGTVLREFNFVDGAIYSVNSNVGKRTYATDANSLISLDNLPELPEECSILFSYKNNLYRSNGKNIYKYDFVGKLWVTVVSSINDTLGYDLPNKVITNDESGLYFYSISNIVNGSGSKNTIKLVKVDLDSGLVNEVCNLVHGSPTPAFSSYSPVCIKSFLNKHNKMYFLSSNDTNGSVFFTWDIGTNSLDLITKSFPGYGYMPYDDKNKILYDYRKGNLIYTEVIK